MRSKVKIKKANDKNESYVIQEKYGIQNGQYGVWESNKDSLVFIPKGSAVEIKKIINHLDTKEKSFMLFFLDAEGNEVRVPFDRKDLNEQGIMSLLAYGAQVTKQSARILIESILNQEPFVKSEYVHESIGFTTYDERTVFLGKKAIGVESKYNGRLKIGKTGKYSEWKEMIETEVLGNIPLEFMLAAGGSGVFVDYLREKVHIDNIIISMIGESSTGKSTAGQFFVSCGAKPDYQGDSLVLNFADTPNALMASIPSGYPVLIDEGSLIRNNPTSLLYSLSMGAEKKRLDKNLEKKESSYFSTAIAMTSEKSLLSISDENSSLLARVLEIENVTWTKDAQSADKIKEVIYTNHGWLVPKLAERIIDLEEEYGEDEIKNLYWECYNDLINEAKEQGYYNSLTERACRQYAVILLSAYYINSVMNIELDVEGITSFIWEHSPVRELDRTDIGLRALTYLMQFTSEHYSQFLTADNSDVTPVNCMGRIDHMTLPVIIDGMSCNNRLYIADVTLQKILMDKKFPDLKVILKKWKEKGILKCEKDRYLSDITIIANFKVKGYVIYLPDLDDNHSNE